jgi:hypothetical protein
MRLETPDVTWWRAGDGDRACPREVISGDARTGRRPHARGPHGLQKRAIRADDFTATCGRRRRRKRWQGRCSAKRRVMEEAALRANDVMASRGVRTRSATMTARNSDKRRTASDSSSRSTSRPGTSSGLSQPCQANAGNAATC